MHTHTLLIADDSIPIQRVIQLTFASGPIRVVVAADGQHALDLIAADRPDIVLASTSLPGVDGYAIARQMSKQRRVRKVPVWLLTSRFEANEEVKIKESGAKGILEKPLESGVVLARVKHALGLHEVQEPVGERASDSPNPAPRKRASKPAPSKPARRRRTAPAARIASTPETEQSVGGALTPEVLAQIVGTAAAHAIATYERSRGAAPAPSKQPPPGLKPAPASPRAAADSWFMPHHQPEVVDLLQLQREMGFDDFALDLVPAVQPAGSVNNREPGTRMDLGQAGNGGPVAAQADMPEASSDWDSNMAGWLATEMRTDQVTRTGPPARTILPAPGTTDLSGDGRTRARTRRRRSIGRADLVLEPVRLALNGLNAWTTRLRGTLRAAEGQARTNLWGLADRCRSVFAAII